MRLFRREGESLTAGLSEGERVVMGALFGEVAELFAHGRLAGHPVFGRLLPAASDDPDVAGEFRRLTEGELRRGKVARLRWLSDAVVEAADGRLAVPLERVDDVAAALTDVRLTLAAHLGVVTADDAEALQLEVELAALAAAEEAGEGLGSGGEDDDYEASGRDADRAGSGGSGGSDDPDDPDEPADPADPDDAGAVVLDRLVLGQLYLDLGMWQSSLLQALYAGE